MNDYIVKALREATMKKILNAIWNFLAEVGEQRARWAAKGHWY